MDLNYYQFNPNLNYSKFISFENHLKGLDHISSLLKDKLIFKMIYLL
jgi:hypothetical protein